MGNDAKLALVLGVALVAAAGVAWYRKDGIPPPGGAVIPSLPGSGRAEAPPPDAKAVQPAGPSWTADGRKIGY